MTNELGLADIDFGVLDFEFPDANSFQPEPYDSSPERHQEDLIPIFPIDVGEGVGFHPIVTETLDSLPTTPERYLLPETVQPLAIASRPLEVCHQLEPLFKGGERSPITEMIRTSVE